MWRKIIFGAVVTAMLIGGAYWFFYTSEARIPVSEGINAVPTDASLIFETKQSKNTWKKLSQTNIMWEELMAVQSIAGFNREIEYIDSILQHAPEISDLLNDRSVFISAHTNEKNDFDLFVAYSLPNLTYQNSIEEYFEEKLNHGKEIYFAEYEGERTGVLTPDKGHTIHFSFSNGILMLSKNQKLIETSIHQLNSGISLNNDKHFNQVINAAGKNVDATVYVNYKKIPGLLNPFIFSTSQANFNSISGFADCSGWDISIKPNALMLSGFTQASDSGNTFLNLFRKQKPQEAAFTKIIPSNTAIFLFFGVSDINNYYQDYKKHLAVKKELKGHDSFIKNTNDKYNINIEESLLSWIDNEMALVITEPSGNDLTNNAYAIFRSNNIDQAVGRLNELQNITSDPEKKPDTTSHRNHVMINLNIPDLLPKIFGWQFNKVRNNWYTSLADYVIFANTKEALIDLIESFETKKTLANSKNYQAFSENISAESNVYLYNAIARSGNIYSSFVKEELAKEIENKKELIKKFEAAGIQFTSGNKLFYSNIYLKYNPEQKQEAGTLWETKFDTSITFKPYLLINHNTKAKEVFIQDDANRIYLISNTGKIIWSKQLTEKIMSDVVQVDVLKNDKFQMVFNTRSFIYMFDRNGNDMKGFPITLRSPATNAIAVIDYERNRDYRIFIATENKRIVCYKADGEQLTAFAFNKTEEKVYIPLQYFNASNKDHLCAIDSKGKIYILDRRGEIRVNIKEQMEQGIRGFFVEPGKDYSRSYILAVDTLGNLIKISLTNHKESIKIQDFETSPYFDLKDINNDKTKEYIFLTRNELKVFSPDRSLLFKHEFNSKITQAPLFFLFPDGNGKIGVVSEESNELFLFNDNGTLFNSFPLNGKTAFSIGDINNEGSYNLVTGSSENSILVYQLK